MQFLNQMPYEGKWDHYHTRWSVYFLSFTPGLAPCACACARSVVFLGIARPLHAKCQTNFTGKNRHASIKKNQNENFYLTPKRFRAWEDGLGTAPSLKMDKAALLRQRREQWARGREIAEAVAAGPPSVAAGPPASRRIAELGGEGRPQPDRSRHLADARMPPD